MCVRVCVFAANLCVHVPRFVSARAGRSLTLSTPQPACLSAVQCTPQSTPTHTLHVWVFVCLFCRQGSARIRDMARDAGTAALRRDTAGSRKWAIIGRKKRKGHYLGTGTRAFLP